MNKKTEYELTITGKLQQLPLPDLEDAIWARVQAQLDLDMPTGDDDGDVPDAPSGGGWWWSAGTFLFVAALVSIFLFTKKNANHQLPQPLQTIQTNTPAAPVEPQPDLKRPLPTQNSSSPPVLSASDPPFTRGNMTAPVADSSAALPSVRLPLFDSVQRTTLVGPPPLPLDTSLPKKKSRGVSGITDNDYRIVPTKDSM